MTTKRFSGISKYTLAICACLALSAVAQPGPGCGQHGGPMDGEGRGAGMRQMIEDLNLTPEQQTQMKTLRENRQGMRDRHENLRDKRNEILNLLKEPKSDESKVLALVEEVNKLDAELNTARVKNMIAMKKILTPDQFIKFTDHIREHMQRHGKDGRGPERDGDRDGGGRRNED